MVTGMVRKLCPAQFSKNISIKIMHTYNQTIKYLFEIVPLISFISHITIIISFKILKHFQSPINSVFNAIFPLFKVLHFSDLNHHLGLPFLHFFWFLDSVFFVYVNSLTLLKYILWKLFENGYRGGTEFESFQATDISSFHSHLVRS